MSLIHEALKKVERQRQLGSAPTLDSPRFRRRRPRWPWLLLLILVFLVAGAWVWRGPLLHKARTVASVLVGSDKVATDKKTASDVATRTQSSTPGAAGKPIASGQPKAAANKPAGPNPIAAGKTTRQASAPKVQPTSHPGKTKDKPSQAGAWLAQQQRAATPGSVPSKPAAAAKGKSGATKPAAKPAAKPANKPAAVGQLEKKGPPMYWELPYDQRRDLPDLNISMHMYTEKPADRFVIINGVRQVQGDTLPSGLKLIAINPESITLDKDGRRFRVPRRGSH